MKKLILTSLAVAALVGCGDSKNKPTPAPAPVTPAGTENPATPPAGADSTKKITPVTRAVLFAHDNLVESLSKSLDATQDLELKKKNLIAAAAISTIETKISEKDNSLKVKIKMIDEKKKASEEILLGHVASASRKIILSSEKESGLLKGTFTCLDLDFPKYCTAGVLELNSKNEKNPVRVLAVIRKTEAAFSLPAQDEYEKPSDALNSLLNIFVSDIDKAKKTDSVDMIQVNSVEVIGGKTSVQLNLITNNKQVIALGGELKQVVNSDIVESELTKNINSESLSSLIDEKDIKKDLQNKIESAQIIQVINGGALSTIINVAGVEKNSRQSVKVLIQRNYPALIQQ